MGFFTITLCEVTADKLPARFVRKYPKHPLPALRLARLAVSQQYKGKGYGGLLLAEAVHRTVLVAEQTGLIGLFVDAKDQNASDFYKKFGFVPIPDSQLQLFLPFATMLKAVPGN
ncbi:GNAT family N-acetyltransferase [Geobacter sp. DSM 9736]|uniref:GNAT family N-acetyltransferase n=1 Tax=Geobacter sp. DSM 9736 TaxID=1277350 RepID=UPI001E56C51D